MSSTHSRRIATGSSAPGRPRTRVSRLSPCCSGKEASQADALRCGEHEGLSSLTKDRKPLESASSQLVQVVGPCRVAVPRSPRRLPYLRNRSGLVLPPLATSFRRRGASDEQESAGEEARWARDIGPTPGLSGSRARRDGPGSQASRLGAIGSLSPTRTEM